jgi:hypothetical protein
VVAAEPASVAEWAEPQPITLGAPDAVPEPATTAAPAASFIDSLRLELAELRKEVSPAVDIEMTPPSDELRERDLTPLPESQSVSAALAALQEFKESFQTEPESAVPVHETADRECVSKETVEHFLHDQGGRMVEDIVRDSVNYLTGSLKDEIAASVHAGVRQMVERELTLILKEAVRLAVSETVPRVVEQTVRDAVQEVMASLGSDIKAEIRKVIPEIAEAIITKEIERISAGLS